jgi:hypothetical protein
LAVSVLLPIGWFVLLVVGGVGVIARQPFCLYVLAAGNAALIASATRNTWDLLVFGRTQGLERARRFGVALLLSKVDTRPLFVDRLQFDSTVSSTFPTAPFSTAACAAAASSRR